MNRSEDKQFDDSGIDEIHEQYAQFRRGCQALRMEEDAFFKSNPQFARTRQSLSFLDDLFAPKFEDVEPGRPVTMEFVPGEDQEADELSNAKTVDTALTKNLESGFLKSVNTFIIEAEQDLSGVNVHMLEKMINKGNKLITMSIGVNFKGAFLDKIENRQWRDRMNGVLTSITGEIEERNSFGYGLKKKMKSISGLFKRKERKVSFEIPEKKENALFEAAKQQLMNDNKQPGTITNELRKQQLDKGTVDRELRKSVSDNPNSDILLASTEDLKRKVDVSPELLEEMENCLNDFNNLLTSMEEENDNVEIFSTDKVEDDYDLLLSAGDEFVDDSHADLFLQASDVVNNIDSVDEEYEAFPKYTDGQIGELAEIALTGYDLYLDKNAEIAVGKVEFTDAEVEEMVEGASVDESFFGYLDGLKADVESVEVPDYEIRTSREENIADFVMDDFELESYK